MRTTRGTDYRITSTSAQHAAALGPVTFCVDVPQRGPFSFQDHLTTQEAITLGKTLIAVAHDIEERRNAAMDDARAAAPDYHVEDDGGEEDERAAA